MTETSRVAILGSCVTRDAFEVVGGRPLELVHYTARSALASFFGRRPLGISPRYDDVDSPFQRRIVRDDLEKMSRRTIRELDHDVLVLDLIDERFSLAHFADGGTATISQEFLKTGIPRESYRLTRFPSSAHWDRWEAGWGTFMDFLDQDGRRDRLVVHQAGWVARTPDGQSSGDQELTAAANDWLERAFVRMARDIPAERMIRVSDAHQLADPSHKWGLSPFHYVPAYYQEFLDRLVEVVRGLPE